MKQLLLIIFAILPFCALCQPPGEGWVKITGDLQITNIQIEDWYTRKSFDENELKLSIYKSDSTTLLTDKPNYDSSIINGKKVTLAYVFIPYESKIVVKIEKNGYETFIQAFDLPARNKIEQEKGLTKYCWSKMPKILLHRSIKTTQLGEAQVSASRLQMVVKGDTLEYNVANLQISAGSMLDNLIRNLPGAKLDNNGRITIKGEFVERLLVNGREFFNGDAMVALRNLPYYTVSKIKVYHNIGTHFENKEDSLRALKRANLTMDVRLKKIYSEMWLANFEAGTGSRTHTNWNSVYFGRFFAMRFTDHSNIGIYGFTNNVGKSYSATHNGNWREMAADNSGEPATLSAGIDYSVDGKKTQLKFNTTLKATRETNDVENAISDQTFIASTQGDIFNRFALNQHSRSYAVDWNSRISKQSGNINFDFEPFIRYSHQKERNHNRRASFNGDPQDLYRMASLDSVFGTIQSDRLNRLLISQSKTIGKRENDILHTGIRGRGRFRFTRSGKSLDVATSVSYNRQSSKELLYNWTKVKLQNSYNENRFTNAPNHSLAYSFDASHLLFSTRSKRSATFSGTLRYGFSHEYSYKARNLYKSNDGTPEDIPDMNIGYAWDYNIRNSYLTDQYANDHTVALDLNGNLPLLKNGKNVNLSISIPFHTDVHTVKDNRNLQQQEVKKTFYYLSPQINIYAMDYALNARYELNPSLPQMNSMLSICDDSYSLNRSIGNPDLKKELIHKMELSWNKFWDETSQRIRFSLTHCIMENHITTAHTYNRETGVNSYMPANISGNWWSSANASFGRSIGNTKNIDVYAKVLYTYANSVDYSSDAQASRLQRFTVHNNRAGGSFGISYGKNAYRVALDGNIRWNGLTSPGPSFRNMSYTDMYYTLSFATPLLWGIDFDTDLKLNMRRGYNEPSMNTTEWVWNAALSTKLGKNGQWVVRAIAFDILHNLSNVTNTINAQGHREWWTNCVQSYASLHLVYHIKVKPSKKGIGEGTN